MHDMFVVKPTNTEEEVLDEVRKRGFSVRQCERRTYTMQRGGLSSFYFDLRERMIQLLMMKRYNITAKDGRWYDATWREVTGEFNRAEDMLPREDATHIKTELLIYAEKSQ